MLGPLAEPAAVTAGSIPPETPVEGSHGDAETDLLAFARAAVAQAKHFHTTELRAKWVRSYRAFRNEHFEGSKYLSERFKQRSKVFRPKTRTAVRKNDAMAASALFATVDVVSIAPQRDDDDMQRASAAVLHELLNYRLDSRNDKACIPWFLTSMGARQDSQIQGICVSKQYWEYRQRVELVPAPIMNPLTGMPAVDALGEPMMEMVEKVTVIQDRPRVDLFPGENVLIDPAADWTSPAQTAAYLILRHPMHYADAKAMMGKGAAGEKSSPSGGRPWMVVDEATIRRSIQDEQAASVRRARDGGVDRLDSPAVKVGDMEIVWIHENFIRWGDEDLHFWSVGTEAYLTDPVLVEEAYPEQQGARPVQIGYGSLESHRPFPMAPVESWQDLQQEINDLANQRLDNVKQNMSPVAKVLRGKQVDLKQVQRRGPDSVLMLNGPDDVSWDRPPDVTSSSYEEHNRLAVELDDLSGSFSGSSVQTNRQLNETVGGMRLLSGNASSVSEYDLRVWVETWVEPVLRQIVRLEQFYESDPTVLAIAGQKANLWQRYGIDQVTDEMLEGDVTVRVNVGMGATDPMQRIQRFQLAAQTIGAILGPGVQQRIKSDAVIEEVMGALGFKDGQRFFISEDELQPQGDPRVDELAAENERLKGGNETKIEQEHIRQDGALRRERMKTQAQMRMKALDLRAQQQAARQNMVQERMRMGEDRRRHAADTLGRLFGARQDAGRAA